MILPLPRQPRHVSETRPVQARILKQKQSNMSHQKSSFFHQKSLFPHQKSSPDFSPTRRRAAPWRTATGRRDGRAPRRRSPSRLIHLSEISRRSVSAGRSHDYSGIASAGVELALGGLLCALKSFGVVPSRQRKFLSKVLRLPKPLCKAISRRL